jgi:hypothetical protein
MSLSHLQISRFGLPYQTAEFGECDLFDNANWEPHVAPTWFRRFFVDAVSWPHRIGRILLEIDSFLSRIRLVARKSYIDSVEMGSYQRRDSLGQRRPNIETLGRRLGIESMLSKRPWATFEDRRVFLEGFEWGLQLCSHVSGNCRRCKEDSKS